PHDRLRIVEHRTPTVPPGCDRKARDASVATTLLLLSPLRCAGFEPSRAAATHLPCCTGAGFLSSAGRCSSRCAHSLGRWVSSRFCSLPFFPPCAFRHFTVPAGGGMTHAG